MNNKLTLRISKSAIMRAKRIAKKRKTSVSKMVENYLSSLEPSDEVQFKISPLVKKLSGSVKPPKNIDLKKEYADYLFKKYQ